MPRMRIEDLERGPLKCSFTLTLTKAQRVRLEVDSRAAGFTSTAGYVRDKLGLAEVCEPVEHDPRQLVLPPCAST